MIQRRTFLGVAAGAALGLATRNLQGATASPELSWDSEVIQTVRHGKIKRKPVVTGVSMQPQGSLLAIVGDDHYVSLYDRQAKRFAMHLKKHTDWVRSAKFSPDSKMLFTCGNDHQLIGWQTSDFSRPEFNVRRKDAIIELAISNDSKKVATVGFNRDLVIYEAETGIESGTLRCACNDNHAVAFSADGKLIAAGGRCGTIRVWDTESLSKVHEIKAHRRRIRSLEFHESGELVSASDDQTVKINNLEDSLQSITLPRHAAKLFAEKIMAPSVIAIGGSDNRIHIWNTTSGSEIGTLDNHSGTVSCLDMAQGVLVSGSFDTTVRIWTPNPNELAIAEPRFVTPQLNANASVDQTSGTPATWTRR
jgi:WD40 repeat protein